jgi:hypothetical protein
MRRSVPLLFVAIVLVLAIVACGGGNSSMQSPPVSSNTATNVSLTISDAPPMGVTVLRFELQVMSASLQPSGAGQTAVSMLDQPQEVELEHLQTEPAFLVNRNVPAGTYTGLSAMFANPKMTILNQTGQTLTVGMQSCATGQTCEITPPLNQSSITVEAPTAPFPLTLSSNSPVALLLHFDINMSIQNDLSISPTISLTQVPPMSTGEFERFHVVGTVSAVNAPNFTLQTAFGNQTLTIATDTNTQYNFGTSCQANNFSCIASGQLLQVKVNLMAGGTLDATEVNLLQTQGLPSFQGVVTSVNASMNQIQLALAFMDDAQNQFGQMNPGLGLTIQPTASATYSIDADGLTLPTGVGFATVQDVLVGQVIRFHPTLPITMGGMGQFTLGADSLTLEDSEITGTVAAVNASATPPNFMLGSLPSLFMNASISQLEVQPVQGTDFENVSGLSALAANDQVSVAGLLFHSSGGPLVVAARVEKRMPGM